MNNGWVKLYRKITEWEWYDNPIIFKLFIHLLLTSNLTDKKWHGTLIKRGQIITSYRELARQLTGKQHTKIGVQQIRTAIDRLKSTQEITIKTNNKFSLITINNYNLYQSLTSKPTHDQHTPNTQPTHNLTTTKEVKEGKNIRKKETIVREYTPSQKSKEFFNNPEKQTNTINYLISKGINEDMVKNEIKKFISYWTEPNKSGTKQRWELEKTFEIGRRFNTWFSRIKDFNKSNKINIVKL